MKKNCTICGKTKDLSCFYKRGFDTYRTECKVCNRYKRNKKYKENTEKIKAKVAEYREKNRGKIIEYMREYNSRDDVKHRMVKYRQDNKKELRLKEREWHKNNPEKSRVISRKKAAKRREDSIIRVRYNVSRAVGLALNRQGSSKAGESTFNYLDYTLDDLKKHLESMFENWMTWDNYGSYKASTWDDNNLSTWTWQIDHIICQADLPYDSMEHPNFKKCWALNNIRPYSSKQNCLDGANKIRNK